MALIMTSEQFGKLSYNEQIDMLLGQMLMKIGSGDFRSAVQFAYAMIDGVSFENGFEYGRVIGIDEMKEKMNRNLKRKTGVKATTKKTKTVLVRKTAKKSKRSR